MVSRLRWCVALVFFAAGLPAQTNSPNSSGRSQLYAGYSFLSNSLNGVPGSHQPLNGYEIAFAIAPWHGLRFKADLSQYLGTNLGAAEHPYFIMGGGQYGRNFGRECLFGEALVGVGEVNADWGAGKTIGGTASVSAMLGGGIDTPLSPHFAWRAEGDYQYAYFKVVASRNPLSGVPTYVPGLPANFARISTGIVWRF